MSTQTIRQALAELPTKCRYHGTDFGKLGFEWGEPRCEVCRPPWHRQQALAALDGLQVAGDVCRRGDPLPADVAAEWAGHLAAELEVSAIVAISTVQVAHRRLPPGWALVRLASINTTQGA